jgi:hypothetical protein
MYGGHLQQLKDPTLPIFVSNKLHFLPRRKAEAVQIGTRNVTPPCRLEAPINRDSTCSFRNGLTSMSKPPL